jgi:hypothetical protein
MNYRRFRSTLSFLSVLTLLLLTACGGSQPSGGASTGMQFTITGGIQHTMNVEQAEASLEEGGADEQLLQLYFNENAERVVFFLLPPDSQAGEYTIGVGGIDAAYLDNSGDSNVFFGGVSGTLTLTEAGNNFAGSFDFAAEESGLVDGDAQNVNVSGSFSNVPMTESESSDG